ncbi:hypothetical protein PHYC_00981 [Phycisphaerales bacterium]|nr:hypothetical protein PHYC_00981 [Phycisphaerales bacterium]
MPTPPPILPIGTAVVVLVDVRGGNGRAAHPKGTAGVVVSAPADMEHAYRVRFPGGDEASLKRREIEVLKHYHASAYGVDPLSRDDLRRFVIYRCIVGSRAYGLDHGESDIDRRGIYLPPAAMHWSIFGVPEQIESTETEECYWELQKFLGLALKANPNVLEALYTPLVEFETPLSAELRGMRSVFLTRLVYQTFNGYAMSQFRKLEQDLRTKGTIKWKHAMHLIRLLLAGIRALESGELPVRVEDEHRASLVALRDGVMPWEDADRWRLDLHERFERAFERTRLPERPDYERVNGFLVRARRSMVESPST